MAGNKQSLEIKFEQNEKSFHINGMLFTKSTCNIEIFITIIEVKCGFQIYCYNIDQHILLQKLLF